MAVEAIGSTGPSSSTARTEFQRAQQKIASDLAEKAAAKVAAVDKQAVTRTDTEALQERQDSGQTAADIGRIGSALDLVV
jgi:hypothetical protein